PLPPRTKPGFVETTPIRVASVAWVALEITLAPELTSSPGERDSEDSYISATSELEVINLLAVTVPPIGADVEATGLQDPSASTQISPLGIIRVVVATPFPKITWLPVIIGVPIPLYNPVVVE